MTKAIKKKKKPSKEDTKNILKILAEHQDFVGFDKIDKSFRVFLSTVSAKKQIDEEFPQLPDYNIHTISARVNKYARRRRR